MDSATYGQHRAAVDVDFRIRQGACSQDVSIVANLTVVTALSSNHFSTFYAIFWPSLVESIHNQSLPLAARIIVYDLGLTSQERSLLERLEGVSITEARQFPYHQYPSYLNVKKARGEYAWKPVIVEQILSEFQEDTMWVDSGARIQPLVIERYPEILDQYNGFFSASSGPGQWTHPGMIEYFVGREKWPKGYQEALNCAAGFLLLRPTNRVMRDLVGPWRACALHRACIAPPGSTRLNHRQDQAALTYLAFTHNFTACKTYPNLYPKNAGLKHQMDNCPDAWTDLERRSLTLVKEELQRLGEELQMPGTDEADADIPS